MPIIINCPGCRRQLKVPEDLLGQDVECPTCHVTFKARENAGPSPNRPVPPPMAEEESHGEHERGDDFDPEPTRGRRRTRDWEDEELDDDDDDWERRHRRRDLLTSPQSSVAGPAIALMVTGGLAFALSVFSLAINVALPAVANPAGPRPNNIASIAGGIVGAGFGVFWSVMVFLGAWQMYNLRNYGLAMAGAIIAMLPCNGCCLLGLPFGIWALVAINKQEVKDAFR